MAWLRDTLHATYVPDAGKGPPPGEALDVLGKEPSLPPRAVAFAVDVQTPVLSRDTHDLTVQMTVAR